jgi:hypothetical protein
VRVVVTATNSFGSTSEASAPTPVIEASYVVNVEPPTIGGDPVDGATLTGDAGEWTGTDVALDYQWRRCDDEGENCTDIDGATNDSLELTGDDVGSTLRLVVTGENAQNKRIWDNEVSATSAATGAVAALAPQIDSDPEVYGDALQGAELEADPGSWSGTPELTYAFQWKRCDDEGQNCAAISGATDQFYVVVSADVASTLRATVTATNAGGNDTATSAATDVVAVPDPPALGEWGPEAYGEPYDGREYIAYPGDWVSDTPLSYGYQWLRCDNVGDNCTPISGADEETYITSSFDLASTIRSR